MSGQKWRLLELKGYTDENAYYIILSGHHDCVLEVSKFINPEFADTMQKAMEAYMPKQFYDNMGSSVRRFANDYVRVTHVVKRSNTEEIDVYTKEELCDELINSGWEMVGFGCHQALVTIEKWRKRY